MPKAKITNAEAHKIAEAVLARSATLLAATEKILDRQAKMRASLPFGPDEDALAWARKKLGNNPRLAEEYLKFEQWKKNRPKLSLEPAEPGIGEVNTGRGSWQAV